MALRTYRCDECGELFDAVDGPQVSFAVVCNCGSPEVSALIAAPSAPARGHEYKPGSPEWLMALSNRKRIEADYEKHLSGYEHHVVPKGIPRELVPQVPEKARKRYY